MKKPTKQQIFKYLDNLATPSMQDILVTYALSRRKAIDYFNEWRQLRQETPVEARPILEAWPEQPNERELILFREWLNTGIVRQRSLSLPTPGIIFSGDYDGEIAAMLKNCIVGVKNTQTDGRRKPEWEVFVRNRYQFVPDPELQAEVQQRLKVA